MIPLADLLSILLISLACAAVVGAIGLIALRTARRASMFAQMCVIVVSTVLSVGVGMIVAAQAMYLSEHDVIVGFYITGSSALVSLAIALILGRSFTRNTVRLQLAARAIGDGQPVANTSRRADSTELAALAAELALTSARLADARGKLEQLDAARREFFAWISHDLRTPLAGLRAMTEALNDQMAADPRRFHRQMISQVDQMSSMVDDLFELSKIHSGTLTLNLEQVSLYDPVSDAVSELAALARSRSVTLREVSGEELSAVGDPRELSRAIGNLLINAIQHTPPGGEIVVATRRGSNGDVVISVQDAGGGIPEADLSRVFDAGWRATSARTPQQAWSHSSGAGLGLAIVQGIVEAHSGEVSVSNIPGGCRFDVSLPRHETVAA